MRKVLSVFLFFAVCACGPPPQQNNAFRGEKRFPQPQDIKTASAWIAFEWGGELGGYGSGFLIDKKRGAFFTNKHVSDVFNSLGKGSHRLFFNGRVYNAEIVKTPPLIDAALIRITDPFDPSEFPEPAPISKEKVRVGDLVEIEGFHPHPYWVREANRVAGFNDEIVPIFRDYYEIETRFADKEKEVVFEKLEGVVMKTDEKTEMENEKSPLVQEARNHANNYLLVNTFRSHLFSFGGLSGSAVKNMKGEVVGILAVEYSGTFDCILAVPIDEVEELITYLAR